MVELNTKWLFVIEAVIFIIAAGALVLIVLDMYDILGEDNPGDVGPVGDTGPTGLDGAESRTGPQGIVGLVGPQGATGAGPTGPQGIAGPAGIQGPQGIAGDTGPVGIQGLKGIDGPAGTAGTQGVQGLQGDPGIQGVTGAQGPAGTAGAPGDTGPTGPVSDQTLNTFNDVTFNSIITKTSSACAFAKDNTFLVGGSAAPSFQLNNTANFTLLSGMWGPNLQPGNFPFVKFTGGANLTYNNPGGTAARWFKVTSKFSFAVQNTYQVGDYLEMRFVKNGTPLTATSSGHVIGFNNAPGPIDFEWTMHDSITMQNGDTVDAAIANVPQGAFLIIAPENYELSVEGVM